MELGPSSSLLFGFVRACAFFSLMSGTVDSSASSMMAGCRDRNVFCPTWADHGECRQNSAFMHQHCVLSCGVCHATPNLERMPLVGWGTCCRQAAKGEPLKASMRDFLRMGGRLIDTAIVYGNHREISEVLHEPEFGLLRREELFITSKIPPMDFGEKETKAAMSRILKELYTEYVDLVLLHAPGDRSQNIAAWLVLEKELAAGRAKAIGVSNFEVSHLEQLVEDGAKVVPMNNQISLHPGQPQLETLRYCREHGISITAYNSIKGRGSTPGVDETLKAIAVSHNKTEEQVLLRWGVEHGISVIPGCTSREHIEQALDVMKFGPLTGAELEALGRTVVMHPVQEDEKHER